MTRPEWKLQTAKPVEENSAPLAGKQGKVDAGGLRPMTFQKGARTGRYARLTAPVGKVEGAAKRRAPEFVDILHLTLLLPAKWERRRGPESKRGGNLSASASAIGICFLHVDESHASCKDGIFTTSFLSFWDIELTQRFLDFPHWRSTSEFPDGRVPREKDARGTGQEVGEGRGNFPGNCQ